MLAGNKLLQIAAALAEQGFMPGKFFLIFIISFLYMELSYAKDSACYKLQMSKASTEKCLGIELEFEINPNLILACKNFSESDTGKLACIRTGATSEAVRLCEGLKFSSEDKTLSCLHYATDMEVLRACVKLFTGEENFIRCIKSGRDVSWLRNCGKDENEKIRLRCLQTGHIENRGLASEKQNADR